MANEQSPNRAERRRAARVWRPRPDGRGFNVSDAVEAQGGKPLVVAWLEPAPAEQVSISIDCVLWGVGLDASNPEEVRDLADLRRDAAAALRRAAEELEKAAPG